MRNGQFGESLLCFGNSDLCEMFLPSFHFFVDHRTDVLCWSLQLDWGEVNLCRDHVWPHGQPSYLTGVIPASCTSASSEQIHECVRLVVKYKCSRLCRFNRNYQLSSEQGKDWGSGASLDLWSDWVTTVLCCESQDWVATSCHCVLLWVWLGFASVTFEVILRASNLGHGIIFGNTQCD